MFVSGRRLFFAVTGLVSVLGAVPRASAQAATASTEAVPAQKFAIPGSADSVSRGHKGPSPQPDTSSKSKPKRRAAGKKGEGKPRPDAPVATFPGFRLLPDGRSRIFVELSKSVTVDEHRADGLLTFTLHGAQVIVRNNKNALITTHFATPVARAR